jgi:uncharacterized protein (TIGR04141 family)
MPKSRPFSIFLLKQGFDANSSLKDNHTLDTQVVASNLPAGATLLVLDNQPYEPWWKEYFGVQKNLKQATKGALIFLPVSNRCLALSFGHVYHSLKDESYEYDFGLRVTLNSVDPKKLKSTDILEPGAAKRRRTQVPIDSDLTFFDFDRDSNILKRLTGKVKDEHTELFKHATGASNLRICSALSPNQLSRLCEKLLELYESTTFKDTFPSIQNITPVRDPSLVNQLNTKVLEAVRSKADSLYLTIPDIVSYENNPHITFQGEGASLIYDDLCLDRYYEYLEECGIELKQIDLITIKKHRVALADENGSTKDNYSVFKGLIFDVEFNGKTYHLNESDWYKVEEDYIKKIQQYLDPLYKQCELPDYIQTDEGKYNEAVAANNDNFICLDKKNISPAGQNQVEPCDLFSVENSYAVLHHVKRSTFSSQLSHLFNQGTNAATLLRMEKTAVEKLNHLIDATNFSESQKAIFKAPLEQGRYQVSYAIITHKPKNQKSKNLPLFSRISLMRVMKGFEIMGINASYGFVMDKTPKKEGRKKPRKKQLESEIE